MGLAHPVLFLPISRCICVDFPDPHFEYIPIVSGVLNTGSTRNSEIVLRTSSC